MAFVLALDQGTTSSRAMLIGRDGLSVATAQREFQQIFPSPGWVEHDAVEIWETQLAVAREAVDRAGITAGEIAAVGITNQRETTVLWERATGRPVHNAIVWQDRRTAEFCSRLKREGHEEMVRRKTGLVLDAYFSGSKIRWLLDNVPGLRGRAEAGELCFGTVDSWLVWNLTGGRCHATDVTNASRTLLLDIETLTWSDELLELFDIPGNLLPEVRACSGAFGDTAEDLFGAPVPIAGVAGDQHAALFGQACHAPGMAKNTYGTGCFLLMNTGDRRVPSQNNLLTTVAWKIGDRVSYALEGSVFIGGAVVQWLRDQLGIIQQASEIEALATEVEDNGGVYFVPAFAGLGAPHWDQYARGAIFGLTRGASRAHLARAALEAVAFQSMELLRAMEADSEIALSELRVDGGASANNLMMQFQADVLGVPIVRPEVAETTALGAAYLAGLAVGFWDGEEEIAKNWQEESRFTPAMDSARVEGLVRNWRRAVEKAKGWVEEETA